MPRFDQSFTGLCEQNLQDTLQLKQRYLDAKTKRTPKSKESKKHQDTTSLQSSVHVQRLLKRPSEDHDGEPPVKLQCTAQNGTAHHQSDGLTKFSVEIVQQLEFTTSTANSQAQQISTNVTVKALTNASVKSDVSSPKSSNPSTPGSSARPNGNVDIGTLAECVKQEPDNDFADLDQCAAALEKDAVANGGTGFGGLSDLIGEDTNDEIITSDAFKDLISDISNYPELMKDFDFDEQKNVNDGGSGVGVNGMKIEDSKSGIVPGGSMFEGAKNPAQNNQNYSPPVFDGPPLVNKSSRISYSNMDFSKTELSPAAQTLKQMAEQHQHKSQIGLTFNPNNRSLNSRSPYQDFQFQGDYGSPSNANFKSSPNFSQSDMIKQEMIFQGNEFDMKRKGAGIYKQQYSPYGSPGASSHGSPGPGYLPRSNTGSSATSGNAGGFNGGTPPRPSSGPGGGNGPSGTTLQINQAQQLHINQQGPGHNIQVSAGQHLQLSGEIKGNVTVAAQQGLYFNQQSQNQNGSTLGQNAQQSAQQSHGSNSGTQQQHTAHQQQQTSNMGGQPGMSSQSGLGPSGLSGIGNPSGLGGMPNQQQPHISQSMSGPNASQQQHSPFSNNITPNSNSLGGSMHNNAGLGGSAGLAGSATIPGMPGSGGMSSQSAMPMSTGPAGLGLGGIGDGFSMSQTQTINFTQQTLRQRSTGTNGIPSQMGPAGQVCSTGAVGGMATRHINPQMIEHQKLLQQQQMFRAQQAVLQQQQQQQQMIRPPPPDYKSSAGLMQGMQNRYPSNLPTIRRMPQPMPPSGPMIRPQNMYMMQQQHMSARNIYPRQQNPISNPEPLPQHSTTEWRHLLMTQQQNANLNPQMRSNFQHQGFNMNVGNIQVSTLQQQQQMRAQQLMVSSNMGPNQHPIGQVQVSQGGPLSQMTNMNQQMLSHIQQHQSMMQQNNNQLAVTNMSLQQTQSMSIANPNMQQPHILQNAQNQLTSSQPSVSQQNSLSSFVSPNDFNLDFLENLSASDSGFTDQELLSSFDSDPGFNFQDIL